MVIKLLTVELINRNRNCSVTARPLTSDPGWLGSRIQVRGDLILLSKSSTSFLVQKIQSESHPELRDLNQQLWRPHVVILEKGLSLLRTPDVIDTSPDFRCRRASVRSMEPYLIKTLFGSDGTQIKY